MESIILIAVMFAMLYFFMIRPENKRKKEADNLRSSLTVGDNVLTIGGITGTVCAVKEGTVVIETGADRVRLEMTKESIATRFTKDAKSGESKYGQGKTHSSRPPRIGLEQNRGEGVFL